MAVRTCYAAFRGAFGMILVSESHLRPVVEVVSKVPPRGIAQIVADFPVYDDDIQAKKAAASNMYCHTSDR